MPRDEASDWISTCIKPYRSTERTAVSAKLCMMYSDDFNDEQTSCSNYKLKLRPQEIPQHKRSKRSICNFCGDVYSWLFGLTTESEMIDMVQAVKGDYTKNVGKVNDVISQQKELGVVIIPADPIYLPASEWNHLMMVEIPCLDQYLTFEDIVHIENTLSILSDTYKAVRNHLSNSNSQFKSHGAEMLYRLTRARSKSIYKDIVTLQKVSQFGWGLFKHRTCKNILEKNDSKPLEDMPKLSEENEDYDDLPDKENDKRSKRDSHFNFLEQSNPQFAINHHYSNPANMAASSDQERKIVNDLPDEYQTYWESRRKNMSKPHHTTTTTSRPFYKSSDHIKQSLNVILL